MGYHFTMAPETPELEWNRRTDAERFTRDREGAMTDPVWRIANLYTIYNKKAKKFVPFRLKPEQRVIVWDIFVRGIKNLIIPKARQIGFSTLLAVIAFDLTLWTSGAKCALVDKTALDGEKKFQDIVRVAWDRLSEDEKAIFEEPVLNTREFAVKLRAAEGEDAEQADGWSRFRVEKSGRGDALVFLWISEWGTIQFEEPKRSTEILTGGMLAAEGGIRVIETTWKGGEDGDVWPFIEQALSKPDSEKNAGDWFLRFFPWWVEPTYSLPDGDLAAIPREVTHYLNDCEEEISKLLGRTFAFTKGQRCWYASQIKTLKLFIKREFPTLLHECWEAPVEDAIYAESFARALAEGRVREGVYDDRLPVFTSWDLGGPQNMVCWYFQVTAGRLKWIDVDMKLMLTPRARVAHMKAKPWGARYAKHFMPHDADHTESSTLSFRGEMTAAGLDSIVVVPATKDIELGIGKVTELFDHMEFDKANCEPAFMAIKQYHRHPERKEPVHDWSSHPCDGLRVAAEASAAGLINLDAVALPAHRHVCWFDWAALDFYETRAMAWAERLKTGVIERDQFLRREPAQSWLRMWEEPCFGQAYLLAVVPQPEETVIGVWRRDQVPILVAAASAPLDLDVMSRRVSALSRLYGRCLVMPAIDDAIGFVALLQADGAGPVWMREEVMESQNARSKPTRKPGFECKAAVLAQIYTTLRARIRERSAEIAAKEFVMEARHFIEPLDGGSLPQPAPGHRDGWVRMCAMALHGIGSATIMAVPQVEARQPIGHLGDNRRVAAAVSGGAWGESES